MKTCNDMQDRRGNKACLAYGPVVACLAPIIAGCYYTVGNVPSTRVVGHHPKLAGGLHHAQLLLWERSAGRACGHA